MEEVGREVGRYCICFVSGSDFMLLLNARSKVVGGVATGARVIYAQEQGRINSSTCIYICINLFERLETCEDRRSTASICTVLVASTAETGQPKGRPELEPLVGLKLFRSHMTKPVSSQHCATTSTSRSST